MRIFLALFALLALAACNRAAPAPDFSGSWRVEIKDHPGGPLPFGLEVSADGKSAFLLNPPERIAVEQLRTEGDRLILAFPSYGSELELRRDGDGLAGTAHLVRRTGPVTLHLAGARGDWRFTQNPSPAAPAAGRWQVKTEGEDAEEGLAIFTADGARLSGGIQFPSGDTRRLSGDLNGDRVQLSNFDGNQSAIWRARLANGKLVDGERWAATSTAAQPWSATAAPGGETEAIAVQKIAPKPVDFAFPDSTGKLVRLSDPRFHGKVVVVSLGGAWCPNCHEEAQFLGPYLTKNAGRGLEMIGLQFEYGDDQARAFRQLDSFAKRYSLPYPLLLAGQPTAESSAAALPFLPGGVKIYPTTLFIDRKGRLREVHVGWAGPATGPLHDKAVAEFDATVSSLLAEQA